MVGAMNVIVAIVRYSHETNSYKIYEKRLKAFQPSTVFYIQKNIRSQTEQKRDKSYGIDQFITIIRVDDCYA